MQLFARVALRRNQICFLRDGQMLGSSLAAHSHAVTWITLTPSRLQPLARNPVGANIRNFTSSVAINRSVNWLPGIADDRPDQRRPMP
jgi:hypothetical protein